MNAERRIQRVRAALRPVGGSKPDWQIISEIARAMGGRGFTFANPEGIWNEVRTPATGHAEHYARLDERDCSGRAPASSIPARPCCTATRSRRSRAQRFEQSSTARPRTRHARVSVHVDHGPLAAPVQCRNHDRADVEQRASPVRRPRHRTGRRRSPGPQRRQRSVSRAAMEP